MSSGCVCGHWVEQHEYTPEEDDHGNRVPGPGTTVCHGNLTRRVEPRTCPCRGYERRRP